MKLAHLKFINCIHLYDLFTQNNLILMEEMICMRGDVEEEEEEEDGVEENKKGEKGNLNHLGSKF